MRNLPYSFFCSFFILQHRASIHSPYILLAGPWEGWWSWIPFTITATLGQGKPGGYLALPGRAALLGGPLFCHLFLLLYGYFSFIFSIGCICYWLFVNAPGILWSTPPVHISGGRHKGINQFLKQKVIFCCKCKLVTLILFETISQHFMKIVPVVFELCAKVCA